VIRGRDAPSFASSVTDDDGDEDDGDGGEPDDPAAVSLDEDPWNTSDEVEEESAAVPEAVRPPLAVKTSVDPEAEVEEAWASESAPAMPDHM
jgi:hypothetical protein